MITITVDEEEIKIGVANNCWLCPTAIAATKAFNAPTKCLKEVLVVYVRWPSSLGAMYFPLPEKVVDEIDSLDHGNFMQPFSFEIDETKPMTHEQWMERP